MKVKVVTRRRFGPREAIQGREERERSACGPFDPGAAAEDEAAEDEVEDGVPEDEAPAEPRRRLDPTADEAEAIAGAAGPVEEPEDGAEGEACSGRPGAAGGGVGSFGIGAGSGGVVGGGSVGFAGGGTTTGGAGSFTGGAGAGTGTVTGGLGSGGMGTVSAKACPAGRQAHTSTVVAAATLIRQ